MSNNTIIYLDGFITSRRVSEQVERIGNNGWLAICTCSTTFEPYVADYVFALPTIAFFMSGIGIFIIAHVILTLILERRRTRGPPIWQKLIAALRYLSYRGFYIRSLQWNSSPVGILLLGLAGTVFFFCMVLAPGTFYWPTETFGHSPALATRSGWLSLACMPFVFATATKTNWITWITGVSHERLQVFHRWISYAFFILALLHTFPFVVYHIRFHDMEEHFAGSLMFYWTGIVALVFQAWLTFASHSTIRNFGYEFFKLTHFLAAAVFMVTFFWHCDHTLTSWDYFIATAALYVPCYVYPWLQTYFKNGINQNAQVAVEDCGFTRITIPAKFDWKPGQHCFLRFTGFGLLHAISSHPFTICSSPSTQPGEQSELVFYIRHQGGFTARLYQQGLEHPNALVPVLVEGPYGGINLQNYNNSDNHLVIAGGSGAEQEKVATDGTESLPADGPGGRSHSGPLSLRIILATRDIISRTWFLRTIGELLSKYPAINSSYIRVEVYLTGEAAQKADQPHTLEDPASPVSLKGSSPLDDKISIRGEGHEDTVLGEEYRIRPQLPLIVEEEAIKATETGGSLSVFVCGPDTMQNDVRNAVAKENLNILNGSKAGGVYLHSEHFSWA
ncbi:hypothetical protein V492_06661 [Pseudogymnoascus sp. VKM F-4246]|nr:hypothetical protein V492_06661 [Pseudogymnoascus sp. VKM F-4246]